MSAVLFTGLPSIPIIISESAFTYTLLPISTLFSEVPFIIPAKAAGLPSDY